MQSWRPTTAWGPGRSTCNSSWKHRWQRRSCFLDGPHNLRWLKASQEPEAPAPEAVHFMVLNLPLELDAVPLTVIKRPASKIPMGSGRCSLRRLLLPMSVSPPPPQLSTPPLLRDSMRHCRYASSRFSPVVGRAVCRVPRASSAHCKKIQTEESVKRRQRRGCDSYIERMSSFLSLPSPCFNQFFLDGYGFALGTSSRSF